MPTPIILLAKVMDCPVVPILLIISIINFIPPCVNNNLCSPHQDLWKKRYVQNCYDVSSRNVTFIWLFFSNEYLYNGFGIWHYIETGSLIKLWSSLCCQEGLECHPGKTKQINIAYIFACLGCINDLFIPVVGPPIK